MDRVILHSDLNSFYAGVECFKNPNIRNKPVVVVGDAELRHGIILTKNQIAKKYGIKTGDVIWEAKNKCPKLITVSANFPLYLKFSRLVREIYDEYTDQREDFGIDESWLDVTHSTGLFGTGEQIANEIRRRIYYELGITVSIGVSFNKVFAKLGSDYAPADSIAVFNKENYKNTVWKLPVSDLLYVGRATAKKLSALNIKTIGDLAGSSPKTLQNHLGVWGIVLYRFANGLDNSPVSKTGEENYIKSVGNSITAPRDLITLNDIKAIIYMLSDSVASRLRSHGLKCTGVQISIRDNNLISCDRQAPLLQPTYISSEIAQKAVEIFNRKYSFKSPVRSLGVRGINLVSENSVYQLNLFNDETIRKKQEKVEKAIDMIRKQYGYESLQKGILIADKKLTCANIKDEHIIHPTGYFKDGKVL